MLVVEDTARKLETQRTSLRTVLARSQLHTGRRSRIDGLTIGYIVQVLHCQLRMHLLGKPLGLQIEQLPQIPVCLCLLFCRETGAVGTGSVHHVRRHLVIEDAHRCQDIRLIVTALTPHGCRLPDQIILEGIKAVGARNPTCEGKSVGELLNTST